MDHIHGCPKEEVGFIWWRVCFSHQALCWRTCFLILMAGIFSTPELKTRQRRGPTSLLMRAAEARQKRQVREKSGYIHMKCGPIYCLWKVESWCISGTNPKQRWRQFPIPCHFNRQCSLVIGRPAQWMGCNLMYTVVSVVRCILTDWNYCQIHFCKCYKMLHYMERYCFMSN